MDSEPLIWTSKGNLPIASLAYSHAWEETPDFLKFSETYTLNGEIVKQSAHVYLKQGQSAQPDQGDF
jgi:hypothetical protein